MIGQVIEIDYHLHVDFGNGVFAILPDFYCDNCVGVWRDFSWNSYITNYDTFEEGRKISSSSTPPFADKKRLEEYLQLVDSNVGYRERSKRLGKYIFKHDDVCRWRKNNGYDPDNNYNRVMRDRVWKVRKLKKIINTL